MKQPTRVRSALYQSCLIGLSLLTLVSMVSLFIEFRFVQDDNFIRQMASVEMGRLYYVEWGMPPPGGKPSDGRGVTLHVGGLLKPTNSRPYPVGQPRWEWQSSFAMPFVVLLFATLILKQRSTSKPIRPGCCPRCGHDLTGTASDVCSGCGMAKPPSATV